MSELEALHQQGITCTFIVRGAEYVELEVHEGPVEDGPASTGAVQGLLPEC